MRGPDHDHDGHPDRVRQDHVGTTHERVVTAQPDSGMTKEMRRDAYERGRADERGRHKKHPFLTLLFALAAVFGLVVIGLYIYNGGSFTETGRDLDSATRRGAQEAQELSREAADEAGEGLQDVGRQVESRGESGSAQPAPAPAPAQERR